MKRTKRWLCLLLVLCMMLSVLPVTASAEEAGAETPKIIEAEGCEQSTDKNSWSGGEYIKTKGTGENDTHGSFTFVQTTQMKSQSITFTLTGLEAGATYDLSVTTKDNKDRGIFKFAVGDTEIAKDVDLYLAENQYSDYGKFQSHELGSVTASADGKIVLTATLTGRNAGNTGEYYGGAFDYFTLTKTSSGETGGETGGEESKQLYKEDFDSNFDAAKLSEGWEVVDVIGGKALQGTKAKDGLLMQLPMTNELPAEYTIVADVLIKECAGAENKGYSAGVTFQHKDGTHFYHFRLDHGEKTTSQLLRWPDRNSATNPLEKHGTTVEDGQAYRLRVTVSGKTITGYVNGVQQFTYTADTSAAGGKLGLRVYNAVALFDNIVVRSGVEEPAQGGEQAELALKTSGGEETQAILVNQIGYDVGTSMRATIPGAADNTAFQVMKGSGKDSTDDEEVFKGKVEGGIADFTAAKLSPDTDTTYYITCDGKQSYDFEVGTNLLQRRTVRQALDFMVQTRSDEGEYGKCGIAWRDSHQFSFELNGLVLQYMANPSVYDNMPKTIFAKGTYVGENKLTDTEYEDLKPQTEPDIIWLIKFAARRYYDRGCTEGKKLHMLTKEQLAYYLYLAPELIAKDWESEDFYKEVLDYTIGVWDDKDCNLQWYEVANTDHDLYSVQTVFGGLKGSQPMGHSIVPNLMMYEVAKRDDLGEEVANKFLKAAIENCAYTIGKQEANLDADGNVINDICDPYFCKGQRMSEYITIPALDYFVEMCPDDANFTKLNVEKLSEGLNNVSDLKAAVKEKVKSWAAVNIQRGDNLWDIRKAVCAADVNKYQFHTKGGSVTEEYWTGAAYAIADNQDPAPKNEPGNQAGLQAVMYAAARVLKDDAATTNRLHALGVAAIDDLFGRNPSGMAAFVDKNLDIGHNDDFEGLDKGWYKWYKDKGNGALKHCTAVIQANAPEACYEGENHYNPSAYASGYTEGWVAYNTAWNASLAYNQAETVALSVNKMSGKVGDTVTVTLTAPINMDTEKEETGTVWVTNNTAGTSEQLTLKETSANSTTFTGSFKLPNAESVTVSYGSGLFARTQTIAVANYQPVKTTALKLTADKSTAKVGETVNLTVEFTPENATDKAVLFESSDEKVATVDENGIVTAVAAGEVTITAKLRSDETVTASVKLTVKEAAQSSYEFDLLGLFQNGKYSYTGDADKAPNEIKDHNEGNNRVKLYGGTVAFHLGEVPAGRYKVYLYVKFYPGGSDSEGTYSSYGTWRMKLNNSELRAINFGTNDTGGSYVTVDLTEDVKYVTLNGNTDFTFVSDGTGPVVPVYVKLTRELDLSKLLAAINEANGLTKSDYTAESWQIFEDALADAKTILDKANATQDEVNAATTALKKAFAGLTPIAPPTPVIPVTPSEPAQNPFNPDAGSNVSKFPFTDVPSNSWYYSSVKAAWENDLIDGVTANEFKPNATLTVAQTIKLAAALHQLNRTGTVSLTNGGANWYDNYVNYAVTNGIIEKDYANYTKAQMNAPVTRGEFVHIFHGAEEAYAAINTVADNAIPDVKSTDKFAAEIYEFYRAGILTGSDEKGTFHSASTIKRSEAAAILLRMFEASARKSITLK